MEYSLCLALVDFIPNIAFALGAFFLVKLIERECGKPCVWLALAGGALVLLSGVLKAIWKLLYVTNIADIAFFNEIQFVLLAPGFLLMLVSVIWFNRRGAKLLPVTAMLPWKIPLLVTMVLSSMGMYGMLMVLAFRRRTKWAALGFSVALLSVLAMGWLTAGEQTVARQWVAEIVNSIGQGCFALGAYLLYRIST